MDHPEVPPGPPVFAGRRRPDLRGRDVRGADLRRADLRGMRLEGLDLTGALLQGADLRDARLFGGSLRGARLDGSRWEGAALIGVEGLEPVLGAPELAPAAIVGRDPVEPMLAVPARTAAIAFSADGLLLAVAHAHAVEIVDAATGLRLRVLSGCAGKVRGVAFAPGAAVLATASDDGVVRIWDVSTGAVLDTLAEPGNPFPRAVAFCPDGIRLAVAPISGTPWIWDTATGTTRQLRCPRLTCPVLAVSPDGQLIAAGDAREIHIHDLATGAVQVTLRVRRGVWAALRERARRLHEPELLAMAFSPDGTRLCTIADDGSAGVWRQGTDTLRPTVGAGLARRRAAAFGPDGSQVVTAVDRPGAPLLLGDVVAGVRGDKMPLQPYSYATSALAYSPDGSTVAAGTFDGHLYVARTSTGKPAARVSGRVRLHGIADLAFSPDGATLATASSDGVRLWDVATAEVRAVLTAGGGSHTLAFSPDGATIATGGYGELRLWDAAAGAQLGSRAHPGTSRQVPVYSRDGRLFAVVSGKIVWVLDAASGTTCATLPVPFRTWLDAAFSPGGDTIAVTTSAVVALWDVTCDKTRFVGPEEGDLSGAVAWSPDGSLVAAAADDRRAGARVHIWDAAPGGRLTVLPGQRGTIGAMAFSPDGALLATGGDDGIARIWDLATGATRFVLRGHSDKISAVAFSPDGRLLATAAGDGTVRLWNPAAGESVARLVPLSARAGAALFDDGAYRLDDDAGDQLWWAVKLCRFAPGELDPYLPALRRRGPADPHSP